MKILKNHKKTVVIVSMCSVYSHIVFHVHLMKAKPLSAVVVHVEREKQ